MAMASATLNSGRCDVRNAAISREMLTVKPYELLLNDKIWVVESGWSVEIQFKVICARPFSCCALAWPTSSLVRKGSGSIDYSATMKRGLHTIWEFMQFVNRVMESKNSHIVC